MKLLTTGNPKTEKGLGRGYLTNILHFAPADMSGFNVCPMATNGCKSACLNTAGRGGIFTKQSHLNMTGAQLVDAIKIGTFTNRVQSARIARTKMFFNTRVEFMQQLWSEIRSAVKLAKLHNLIPTFRLNGTSDLRWETFQFHIDPSPKDFPGGFHFANIMEAFPTIQFYDYTKIANRRNLPTNYNLTFSLAEDNEAQATQAIANGMNVAVVFNQVPTTYRMADITLPVIVGDESDLRFLDPKNVIVGLKAKGKAKKDKSGFVK